MLRSRLRLACIALAAFIIPAIIFRIFANWYGRVRARESAEAVGRTPIDHSKPTIVVVHGLGGSAYKLDVVHGPEFISFANVITINLPGHGGKPAMEGSVEAQAEFLRECISDKLARRGIDSCVLFGISFGGEILTRLMVDLGRGAKAGFRVDGFIAFEPPYRGEYAKPWQRKLFKFVWVYYRAICLSFLKGSPTAQKFAVELVARFIRVFGGVEREKYRLHIQPRRFRQKELFEHLSRYNEDHLDWEQWLNNIYEILTYDGAEHIADFLPGIPVLLLSGEDSMDPIVNTVEYLADDLSDVVSSLEVVMIPGAHDGVYEYADIVAQHIKRFLENEGLL